MNVKTQIIWTVITLSSIAVLLIYIIIHLYIYELTEQSLKCITEYYYSIQKQILQNIITFQNYFLFNYEDTLKILISQIVLLLDITEYFKDTNSSSIVNYSLHSINYSNCIQRSFDKINDTNFTIFYMNFGNISLDNTDNEDFLKLTFRIVNIFSQLRIPYYGDYQLFDGIVIYLNKTQKIFSLNDSFLCGFLINQVQNNNLNEYYSDLVKKINEINLLSLENILTDNTIFPEMTLSEEFINMIKSYGKQKNINFFSKYSPYLDYKREYLHLIKTDKQYNEIFITAKLTKKLIDYVFLKIMGYFNITTLLITPEDDTVLNVGSCQALLTKIKYHSLYENYDNNLKEINEKMNDNENDNNRITIDKCLLDYEDNYYKQYLIQNNTFFYEINSGYNSSFIQLLFPNSQNEYMVTRYSYPDYFLIAKKRPNYFIPTNLKVYTFMNYYFPYSHAVDNSDFLLLNFYTITSSNWHFWILIFIMIFIICLKLSRDITGPLIKLKRAIDRMSFSDQAIFEYKDDEIINELFVMCKELVNKDEFKKSLNEKSFIDDKKILEDNENNSYSNGMEYEENTSLLQKGINRNLIINNQLFEKNRKLSNQENQFSFDKEIVIYKDINYYPKTRPRNQSRKRPKAINNLIRKKLNAETVRFRGSKTKGDYNMKSKLRDSFLRESLLSNNTKKDSKISFEESGIKKEKGNRNDNELNILLYEFLFYLGKNMFKTTEREKVNRTKFFKSEKSLTSDVESCMISTKNVKKMDEEYSNKFYSYAGPIFVNNDNAESLYEDRKITNALTEKKKKNKLLIEQYQIKFPKNDLYYKYLKAKSDWNNRFLKQFRIMNDLELDSSGMVELDDDDNLNSMLPRRTMRKNESTTSLYFDDKKSNFFLKREKSKDTIIDISPKTTNNFKVTPLQNQSEKKSSVLLEDSSSNSFNPFGTKVNQKQKRLGMRASISMNNMVRKRNFLGKSLDKIKHTKSFNFFE